MSCDIKKFNELLQPLRSRLLRTNISNKRTKKDLEDTLNYLQVMSRTLGEAQELKSQSDKELAANKSKIVFYTLTEILGLNEGKKYISYDSKESFDLPDVISFNKETVLNSVNLDSNDDFPLSTIEKEMIEETKNAINEALINSNITATSELSTNNAFTPAARSKNPALNFIKLGDVHTNIVVAIRSAIDNYIVNNYKELSTPPESFMEIADLLGISFEDMELNYHLVSKFKNGGLQAGFAANDIGKDILQSLGISVNKSKSNEEYAALIAGFGNIALLTMNKLGYIQDITPPLDVNTYDKLIREGSVEAYNDVLEGTGKFVKINNGAFYVETGVFLKPNIDIYSIRNSASLMNDITGEKSTRMFPSQEPLDITAPVKIRRGKYTSAPNSQVEAIIKLKAIPWEFNTEAINLLEEIFGTDWTNHPEILNAMGYPLESEIKSKSTAISENGKRSAIKQKLNQLKEFYDSNEENTFYYDWFVGRNLRLHISNLVNPQDDKIFTRWLVQPKGSSATIKVDDLHEALNNPDMEPDRTIDNFIYGIVQAFDGYDGVVDVEKNERKDVIKSFNFLKDKSKDELITMLRNKMSSGETHAGHTITAINALLAYQNAKEGVFTTSLLRETDGKTNGYFHKVLQMPLGTEEDYKPLLDAVGVIDADMEINGKPVTTMAQVTASKTIGDIYQLIAFNLTNIYKYKMNELGKGIKPFIENLPNKYKFDSDSSITSPTEVKKELRNFVKPSATEVMYAASTYNSSKARVKEITDELMNKFSSSYTDEVRDSISQAINTILSTYSFDKIPFADKATIVKHELIYNEFLDIKDLFNNFKKIPSDKVRESIINNENNHPLNRPLYDTLLSILTITHGNPLKDSLDAQFAPYEEFNKSINNGMQFVYLTFAAAFENAYLDLRTKLGRAPSTEEKDEIVAKLIDILPAIDTADSVDAKTRLSLIKNSLSTRDFEGDISIARYVTTTTALKKGKYVYTSGKPLHIASLVTSILKDIFKEPGASTLANATHANDSTNMSQTVINSNNMLPIHDAVVFGLNVKDSSKNFNESGYLINKDYSMVKAILDAIDRSYKYAEKNHPNLLYADLNHIPNTENQITIDNVKSTLIIKNKEIAKNRIDIFSKPKKVGQMVDTSGSMYNSIGFDKKDVANYEENSMITTSKNDTIGNNESVDNKTIKQIINNCE